MHVQCGNLPLTDDVTWKCATCHEMIIKMPPRAKHNFRKIQQLKKSSQRNVLAKLLTKSRITISASNSGEQQINLSSSSFSASAKACPKFEIPKPVKLGPRHEEVYKDIAIQTIEKIVQEKACLKPILRLPKIELFPNEISIENDKESTASIGSNDEVIFYTDESHPQPSKVEENRREYDLPFGWKKVAYKLKGSDGQWSIKIRSPNEKTFHSNKEIQNFVEKHPEIKYDSKLTNTSRPPDLRKKMIKVEEEL